MHFSHDRYGDGLLKAVYAPDQKNTFKLTTVGAYDRFVEDRLYERFHKPLPYTHEWFIYQAGAIAAWAHDNGSISNSLSLSGALWDFNNHDSFTGHTDTLADSVRSEWR